MKKTTLPELVSFLNQLAKPDFTQKTFENYITRIHIDQDEFAPFIYFREETYGRNLIARGKNFELLALTWLPQQRTPIHDHSGQKCWMMVLSGKLAIQNYKPTSASPQDLIPCGPVEVHSAGEWIYIDDDLGIHSITNASSKPAVSVHLYVGPISECRIFNESKQEFQWVELKNFTNGLLTEGETFEAD
jgi:cysteine dioxygenase